MILVAKFFQRFATLVLLYDSHSWLTNPQLFLKLLGAKIPKGTDFKRDARAEKKTLLLVNTFQKRLERNFFQQVVCDAENYVKDSQAVSAELQNFKMVNLYKVEKSRKNRSPLKKNFRRMPMQMSYRILAISAMIIIQNGFRFQVFLTEKFSAVTVFYRLFYESFKQGFL